MAWISIIYIIYRIYCRLQLQDVLKDMKKNCASYKISTVFNKTLIKLSLPSFRNIPY